MANITIVSPNGNPEVWPEDKAQAKLQQGYKTQAAWLAEQEVMAEQKRQEWLNDPDTAQERFQMLRHARDAKISATDYLMTADYPLSETNKAQMIAYRQALRDLPAQAGAPWDGGGELTPWPQKPALEG